MLEAEQDLIDQVAHSSHEVDQLKANQLQLTESHTLTLQLQLRDQQNELQHQIHDSEEYSAKALRQQHQDLDEVHFRELREQLQIQAQTSTQQSTAVLDTHRAESSQSAATILLLQTQLQTATQVAAATPAPAPAAAPVGRYARQGRAPPVSRPPAGLLFTPNDSGSADGQPAAHRPPHHFRRPSQRQAVDLTGLA